MHARMSWLAVRHSDVRAWRAQNALLISVDFAHQEEGLRLQRYFDPLDLLINPGSEHFAPAGCGLSHFGFRKLVRLNKIAFQQMEIADSRG